MTNTSPLSYRDAGVDIDAGNRLVKRITPLAERTHKAGVLGNLGGFGGLFELPLHRYRQPVLVSGTDGVGTKLKVAMMLGKHDTIGIDLVAMCVNDILVSGAEPLFFLDYFATAQLDVEMATQILEGIVEGCIQSNMALIGGETAEMPGFYAHKEYDLAGFTVGIVEKERMLVPQRIQMGDLVLGLASSGAHSNGYSLIRHVLETGNHNLDLELDGQPLGELLIAPTRIYVKSLLPLIEQDRVRALAHITGGGLLENLPRVLPPGLSVEIYRDSWKIPSLFRWLQQQGHIQDKELLRTFNCGIGMVLILAESEMDAVTTALEVSGEGIHQIGRIVSSESRPSRVCLC